MQFNLTTTLYTLVDLKLNAFLLFLAISLLFSIAGIPPLIGFFTKIFILLILINSQFFNLYLFYFILLFFGLYFYMQNVRMLLSTAPTFLVYTYAPTLRLNVYFYVVGTAGLLLLYGGVFCIDDILFYLTWLGL